MMKKLLITTILSFSSLANSSDTVGPACYVDIDNNPLKSLDPIGHVVEKLKMRCGEEKLKVGDSCVTSKGFIFKYLGNKNNDELYEDVATGVIWGDKRQEALTFTKATAECEKANGKLPTLNEIGEAEDHGFREVLPNSSYSYTARELNLKLKTYDTHVTYWAGDTFTRTRFGLIKFKKAYAYKMAKDYFEAFEMPGDADASMMPIRCIYSKKLFPF